ncbi:MAG: type III pantothenate kinase [Spirochaetaceae bacterium]|nr:type III pantothenate kinase [Spirochaetaceae bacterium]
MVLTLDIGNTQISGGVFLGDDLILQFRHTTAHYTSSDELGVFMRSVFRENGLDSKNVTDIVCCSVVPSLNYPLTSACIKYFDIEPLLIRPGIATGLELKYANPKEIGADRIAAAIGAASYYKNANIIIVDMGTATTVDILTARREFLGGVIMAGVNMSMQALSQGTAQLPNVEIALPARACGTSTAEAIQSGLYYGALGGIKELIAAYTREVFGGRKPMVIGTGGFSHLFQDEDIFNVIIPSLIFDGLYQALKMNKKSRDYEESSNECKGN